MTRKQPQTVGNWAVNNATSLLTLAAICFGFAGFYFNTSSAIDAQAKNIASIESRLREADKNDQKRVEVVNSDREQLRKEFSLRAEKTAEGISSLNEKTAILSTQLGGIKDELVKVSSQLSNLAPLKR